jgi:hypothetical protein
MNFEETNILTIKGVFLKDCQDLEDIFEDKLMETISLTEQRVALDEPKIYNKIPLIFTNKENWIKKTNILCWYCNLEFTNIPIFIPENILKNANGQYMEVYGNFCSFGCAQGFIDTNNKYSERKRWQSQELLKVLYRKIHNKEIDIIHTSPSKLILEKYGGKIKEKIFKEDIMKIDKKNR